MATPESDAGVKKMYQHMQEVEAGLVPEFSPPDFVRSDWKQDEHGFPGWFGPDWHPTERAIVAAAEAQAQRAVEGPDGTP